MVGAIRIHEFGGPDACWEQVDVVTRPVLIRQTAVGLNFIDTYHRLASTC